MKLLTQDAVLRCDHDGRVIVPPTQDLVTIVGRAVLVEPNPQTKSIVACPNIGGTMKPCTTTLPVQDGYSNFVRIQGQSVCLDTVIGLTDGTLPGTVHYRVRDPGQDFVSEAG